MGAPGVGLCDLEPRGFGGGQEHNGFASRTPHARSFSGSGAAAASLFSLVFSSVALRSLPINILTYYILKFIITWLRGQIGDGTSLLPAATVLFHDVSLNRRMQSRFLLKEYL